MTPTIRPTIEAIDTRRAWQQRAESRHRRFEPVYVPGDERKWTWGRVWTAFGQPLMGIGFLLYVAALVWAYTGGWNG